MRCSPRRLSPPALLAGAVLLVASMLTVACGSSPKGMTLKFSHNVDGNALVFDDVRYTNAAGNEYSVSRLEYYVSKMVLGRATGAPITLEDVHYCDARDTTGAERALEGVPPGDYTSLTLFLGIGPALNVTGGLPNTVQNTNMAWPVPMGGGYHFLKLEGHWRDAPATTAGFAMHLGTNAALVTVSLNQPFSLKEGSAVELKMNVNEWFRNPSAFDFATDPNYTMGNMAAMTKLRDNGADVLSLEVR